MGRAKERTCGLTKPKPADINLNAYAKSGKERRYAVQVSNATEQATFDYKNGHFEKWARSKTELIQYLIGTAWQYV